MAERISAWVGGYMGRSFGVEVSAELLTYRAWGHGYAEESELVEPVDPAALARFWDEVERLGAWTWEARYEDPAVLDGTGWRLELERDGRRLAAEGGNAYPAGWDALCAAVSRLAGGREFR